MMWFWNRQKKKTVMDDLRDKRIESAMKKMEAADKGMEILNALRINRRLEDLGPDGHMERRKASA